MNKSVYESLEYPLPLLATESETIVIETSARYEAHLTVRNKGGGVLSGRITSNTRCLVFTPEEFEGNRVKIHYSFSPGSYKTGDTVNTGALIISNGGEKLIPVVIRITPPAIITEEGNPISSLQGFAEYAKEKPQKAQVLFASPAFKRFLTDMGHGMIAAYEKMAADPSAERAMEQFLIISGLKERTRIIVLKDFFDITVKPGDVGLIHGIIPIRREGWGYFDEPVVIRNSSPWLNTASHISQQDFKNGDLAEIPFAIDPRGLTGKKYNGDAVLFGGEKPARVRISVRRLGAVEFRVLKESYGFSDSGTLIMQNNTAETYEVEITPSEPFIRFDSLRRYFRGYMEVPFQIKMNPLMTAQFAFMSQPYVVAEIEVREKTGRFKKTIRIHIGEWA